MNRKWIKRLTVFGVGLTLVIVLSLAGLYFLGVRRAPTWLRNPITATERAAAAMRAEEKIRDTISVVGEMNSYAASSQPADPSDQRPVASQPPRNLKIEITEDELNALFTKWDDLYGWTERFKDYVQEPSIVLHDGRVILAGQSAELGTVISIHFEPTLDAEGELQLRLSKVLAGRLPLPRRMFDRYRDSAQAKLEGALPGLQQQAKIESDGTANSPAMSAAMAQLFLHVLEDEPAEPVLFVPLVRSGSVPVRITEVKVADKSLFLTVKPLNALERAELLKRIRVPQAKMKALPAVKSAGAAPASPDDEV